MAVMRTGNRLNCVDTNASLSIVAFEVRNSPAVGL